MTIKALSALNLTMAIIYTVILALVALAGAGEDNTSVILGCVILSGSVIANWITWANVRKYGKED